jgi:hypothetical protein
MGRILFFIFFQSCVMTSVDSEWGLLKDEEIDSLMAKTQSFHGKVWVFEKKRVKRDIGS